MCLWQAFHEPVVKVFTKSTTLRGTERKLHLLPLLMKQKEAALVPILSGLLDKVPYTHNKRGKCIAKILGFLSKSILTAHKVSALKMPASIIFNNVLLSKPVSSGCEGKAHHKGRSIKSSPSSTRPKKNMRNYSASEHYTAQIEFCSF